MPGNEPTIPSNSIIVSSIGDIVPRGYCRSYQDLVPPIPSCCLSNGRRTQNTTRNGLWKESGRVPGLEHMPRPPNPVTCANERTCPAVHSSLWFSAGQAPSSIFRTTGDGDMWPSTKRKSRGYRQFVTCSSMRFLKSEERDGGLFAPEKIFDLLRKRFFVIILAQIGS